MLHPSDDKEEILIHIVDDESEIPKTFEVPLAWGVGHTLIKDAIMNEESIENINDDQIFEFIIEDKESLESLDTKEILEEKYEPLFEPSAQIQNNSLVPKLQILKKTSTDSSDSPFQRLCHICQKTVEKKNFINHMENHGFNTQQSVQLYNCYSCSLKFRRVQDLQDHVRLHCTAKFLCGVCGLQHKTAVEWATHMFDHTNAYVCPVCWFEAKPPSQTVIVAHIKRHRVSPRYEGSFHCKHCSEEFETIQVLLNHLKTHGRKDFPCGVCGADFQKPLDWSSHVFNHLKLYICPICGFQAKTSLRSSIATHIKRHEGDFVAFCEICGLGFFSHKQLAGHMEMHMDIPKYKCEICDKTFTVGRYLKVHQNLNHKKELFGIEEVFQCELCDRKFTFEKSLRRHLSVIHKIGADRTVPCPVCKKVIANNYNLKKHMRTHTGETSYCCDLCGKAFTDKKYWQKHKKTHLKEDVKETKSESDGIKEESEVD